MTGTSEWMQMVPAARRLGISVRELYAAVDQGRIEARSVRDPLLWIEVAVDDGTSERLSVRAG